ncbi:MAG: hypothetical protein LBD06_09305, partial [Candidatus Accumulibacter sp.]|nr:hypothetical protein [Accumulibacter sp.]
WPSSGIMGWARGPGAYAWKWPGTGKPPRTAAQESAAALVHHHFSSDSLASRMVNRSRANGNSGEKPQEKKFLHWFGFSGENPAPLSLWRKREQNEKNDANPSRTGKNC